MPPKGPIPLNNSLPQDQPSNRRTSRLDVARLAQVSVATVSYVVNGGPKPVSRAARERVEAAIQQLGYRPHAIARSLRTGRTRTIGLVVPTLLTSFMAHLVTEVEDNLARHGHELILASSHENNERERRLLEILADRSIDGLLFIPTSADEKSAKAANAFLASGIQTVFIDRFIGGVQADVVMTDHVGAARMVTQYLIAQGARDIALVSFSEQASSALERIQGYREALVEAELPVDESRIVVVKYASGQEASQAVADHVAAKGVPDAVLCTSDTFLTAVIRALRELGVRVPTDVLVAGGFAPSTSPWHDLLDPPPPIVRQNYQLIAERAVTFLMERIGGDAAPPRTQLIEAEFFSDPISLDLRGDQSQRQFIRGLTAGAVKG